MLSLVGSFECLSVPVEQGENSDANVDVTPYPDMQRKIIDINNMGPVETSILKQNNLSLQQIKEMQDRLKYLTFPSSSSVVSTTTELATPTAKE